MTEELQQQFPGVEFNFSQYIQDNVEEAASGVKGENSVKVYGNDLETLEKTADADRRGARQGAGHHGSRRAALARASRPSASTSIACARRATGLRPATSMRSCRPPSAARAPAICTRAAATGTFPMMVRLAAPYRQSLDSIRRIPIAAAASNGNGVDPGAARGCRRRASGLRRGLHLPRAAAALCADQVQRARPRSRQRGARGAARGRQQVLLPGGYRLEWVGEFGNLQEAISRLSVAVPLSIALIVLLLYLNFGSLRDALLAASVIPMALLGGIFALWATGTPFSVSSAIGFVALFGIAAMDGILVVSYYHLSLESGLDRASAMLQTCRTQLRPVMMTCTVACVGLIPAAVSTGIGSQVQRPLALVVVGGMLLAPVLILLVLPVLILQILHGARAARRNSRGSRANDARASRPPVAGVATLAAVVRLPRARCCWRLAWGRIFTGPRRPRVERYTDAAARRRRPHRRAARAAPRSGFLRQQDVPRNWWTLFGSAELDDLVERGPARES